jgi:hypothetical protein
MLLTAERRNCRSCNAIHGLIHSRNVARMIALRAHNTAAIRTSQIKNAPASQVHTTPHSTTALTGGHRTGPRPARVPRAGICPGCHRHRIVPDHQVIPHPVRASYASPAPCQRPVVRAHPEPHPARRSISRLLPALSWRCPLLSSQPPLPPNRPTERESAGHRTAAQRATDPSATCRKACVTVQALRFTGGQIQSGSTAVRLHSSALVPATLVAVPE